MPRTAKVFMTNRSQAVDSRRIPVLDRRSVHSEGGQRRRALPKPQDWRTYFASAPVASDAFMAGVEDLPVQEREA